LRRLTRRLLMLRLRQMLKRQSPSVRLASPARLLRLPLRRPLPLLRRLRLRRLLPNNVE